MNTPIKQFDSTTNLMDFYLTSLNIHTDIKASKVDSLIKKALFLNNVI